MCNRTYGAQASIVRVNPAISFAGMFRGPTRSLSLCCSASTYTTCVGEYREGRLVPVESLSLSFEVGGVGLGAGLIAWCLPDMFCLKQHTQQIAAIFIRYAKSHMVRVKFSILKQE